MTELPELATITPTMSKDAKLLATALNDNFQVLSMKDDILIGKADTIEKDLKEMKNTLKEISAALKFKKGK